MLTGSMVICGAMHYLDKSQGQPPHSQATHVMVPEAWRPETWRPRACTNDTYTLHWTAYFYQILESLLDHMLNLYYHQISVVQSGFTRIWGISSRWNADLILNAYLWTCGRKGGHGSAVRKRWQVEKLKNDWAKYWWVESTCLIESIFKKQTDSLKYQKPEHL